jgi:hypothetical protein
MLVASNGVNFSGTGEIGDGGGAVYGAFNNTGAFPDGLPGVNSYASWESLTASDYYLIGGAGGGGAGADGQGTSTSATSSTSRLQVTTAGVGLYSNGGTLTLPISTLPNNPAINHSETGGDSGNPGAGPAIPSANLVRMAQLPPALNLPSTGLENTPLPLASIGGAKTSPLAPLLGSNMAGWAVTGQGQKMQSLLSSVKSETQALDAVFTDLAGNPLTPAFDLGRLATL